MSVPARAPGTEKRVTLIATKPERATRGGQPGALATGGWVAGASDPSATIGEPDGGLEGEPAEAGDQRGARHHPLFGE